MFCFPTIYVHVLSSSIPSPTHSHIFFHFPACPSSLPLCHLCCTVLHYVTLCNSVNGSIVRLLKVVSCSFIKVHCFPRWNNKRLCVSQWASNNRQKDATSSHSYTKYIASGVFLITQQFGTFAFWFYPIWEKQPNFLFYSYKCVDISDRLQVSEIDQPLLALPKKKLFLFSLVHFSLLLTVLSF